ncbi:MAG: hypothetical protein HOV92_18065 [Streptomyces sp.]|nr:hypothetical protein [Streptomyces sp.]
MTGIPEERLERYITALRGADKYALIHHRDDFVRFAKAVIAVANDETDPVYRDGYAAGRQHSGASSWAFDNFEAVISTSNGDYGAAEEYRCRACGAIGGQGIDAKSLLDLMAMAARHECLPRVTDTTQGDSE